MSVPVMFSGRIVGRVEDGVFRRLVRPEHVLRNPPAIAFHREVLDQLLAAECQVLHLTMPDGEVLTTPLSLYYSDRAIPVNRSHGAQVAVRLADFAAVSRPETVEVLGFEPVTGEDAVDETRPSLPCPTHQKPTLDTDERLRRDARVTVWPEGSRVTVRRNRRHAPPSGRRCVAMTAKGERCRRPAASGDNLCAVHGGAVRPEIREFTTASRRTLQLRLAMLRQDVESLFVTLTWPSWAKPDGHVWYDVFDRLRARMQRRWPTVCYVWKRENTKAGVPHLHLLVYGVKRSELLTWLPVHWTEATGVDRERLAAVGVKEVWVQVEQTRTWYAASDYIRKYVTKSGEADTERMGRWWGIVGVKYMPWSREVSVTVYDATAVRLKRVGRKWIEADRRRRGLPKLRHPWSSEGLSLMVRDPAAFQRLAEMFDHDLEVAEMLF